ncbi:unnamed protein product [Thlaspi arvense]|uniref:Pectinesterase inhibitor domain-containing protein n=1 Tax=Thlaspi arvense TaxID=13288 RepID=A0AAU9SPK9_THLAR|nr:unnamed protein product [Thlaspi arvense]
MVTNDTPRDGSTNRSRRRSQRRLSSSMLYRITLLKMQVDDATTHLKNVDQNFSGPNGKRRINVCKTNYVTARARFQTAWEKALNKSFSEANILARDGANIVTNCENGWKRGGPPQISPLTLYNTNVSKLYGIISVITKKLGA